MKITSDHLLTSLFIIAIYIIIFGIPYQKRDPSWKIEQFKNNSKEMEKEKEKENENENEKEKYINPWCGDVINIQQADNPYKKIISFSAYQKNETAPLEKWIEMGIIDNELGKKLYFPDWIMRAYILHPSPELESLLLENNWEVVRCIRPKRMHFSMLFRFFAYDNDPWFFISRDIDSRLSPRELFLINEWISSGYSFHTIRDHMHHSIAVLGGMFGMRRGSIKGTMINLIQKALDENNNNIKGSMGEDQNFLQRYIWPQIKSNALEHDSFGRCFGGKECRGFPEILDKSGNENFIGSPFKFENHVNPNCSLMCEYNIT